MRFEQKLLELHQNARRIALHYAIRKGAVPPELTAIVEATRAPHVFFTHYRLYPSGEWATDVTTAKDSRHDT